MGPKSGSNYTSYTLAQKDPSGNGTFIQNNSLGVGGVPPHAGAVPNSDAIVMSFSAPINLSSISFDYEIFPDTTCPSLSNCGANHSNLPDISVTDTSNRKFSLKEAGNISKNHNTMTVANTTRHQTRRQNYRHRHTDGHNGRLD